MGSLLNTFQAQPTQDKMVVFTGKFKETKKENIDQFYAKLLPAGTPPEHLKAAAAMTPIIEITELGPNKYRVTTVDSNSGNKVDEEEFQLGVQRPLNKAGRKGTTITTKEGNSKFVTVEKGQDAATKDLRITMEFTNAGINLEMAVDGVVAKSTMVRQ